MWASVLGGSPIFVNSQIPFLGAVSWKMLVTELS